jgi:hypothetical protein
MLKIKKNTIYILLIILSTSSCLVSRLGRPKLTGHVYDFETKKPIAECSVGETKTDNNGFYVLKEKRYYQFTFIGLEAPNVHVYEKVSKQGYKTNFLKAISTFGGGAPKGTHWKMPPLYLKKENN